MKVTIEIDCGNSAFEDNTGAEVSRLLRELAAKTANDPLNSSSYHAIRDTNGNTVGSFRVGWPAKKQQSRRRKQMFAPERPETGFGVGLQAM
jgi:hypothetical protein